MKVLLIGFGSIGKRHYEILDAFSGVNSIDIVTKQTLDDKSTYSLLADVPDLTHYDYFVISSETNKHYKQLLYICSKVEDKKILVEKPLYDRSYDDFTCRNHVFTAYNLRFHPVLQQLKHLLENEPVYYVNAICGQYLPTWRPSRDYKKSYSADIKQGGGVLRDLSHELDYLISIFGDIKKIDSINTKISDLEIDSDDLFTAIAITKEQCIINVTIDYISKVPLRRLIIHTKEQTIQADLIANTITLTDKNSDTKAVLNDPIERNYTYREMHKAIINDNYTNVCSFKQGKNIVELINSIEFMEL